MRAICLFLAAGVWGEPIVAQQGGDTSIGPRVHFSFRADSADYSFKSEDAAATNALAWPRGEAPQPALWKPIGGGLIGGVVGTVGGALFGGFLAAKSVGQDGSGSGLAEVAAVVFGIAVGAALGEPWGLACGVHIGNGRRGNAPVGIVAAALLAAAGVTAALATKDERVLIAVPLVQLAVVVPIERATARPERRSWRVCKSPF